MVAHPDRPRRARRRALIACPSITPARGEVFDVLEEALRRFGFDVHRFVLGEAPDGPTENMVAIRGSGAPHFGFAGHLDVVPPGEGWSSDPFEARIEDGRALRPRRQRHEERHRRLRRRLSGREQAQRHAVAADHRRRGRLCRPTARRGSSTG